MHGKVIEMYSLGWKPIVLKLLRITIARKDAWRERFQYGIIFGRSVLNLRPEFQCETCKSWFVCYYLGIFQFVLVNAPVPHAKPRTPAFLHGAEVERKVLITTLIFSKSWRLNSKLIPNPLALHADVRERGLLETMAHIL